MARLPRSLTLRRSAAFTAGGLAAAVGLTFLGGGVAVAAGGLNPPAVAPATVFVPSAVPDRVILTPTATPETSQSVSWRTSSDVTSPQMQLAPLTATPVDVAAARTITATTTGFESKLRLRDRPSLGHGR